MVERALPIQDRASFVPQAPLVPGARPRQRRMTATPAGRRKMRERQGGKHMGFVAPGGTGFIVGATNSFSNAFLAAGAVLVIGIVHYVFLFGRIEPIPEPAS